MAVGKAELASISSRTVIDGGCGRDAICCLIFLVRQGDRGVRGSLVSRIESSSRSDLQRTVVAKDTEGFQLTVQGRSFHADKSGGAGYVAAEAGHLGDQVFALEDFARVAQRQGHD